MEKYHTYSICKEGINDVCIIHILGISKKMKYHSRISLNKYRVMPNLIFQKRFEQELNM
jgi:hypothetical protein